MPKRNSLTDVGPVTGQLKSSFTNLESTQITALSGMLGGVNGNRISGDVSNSIRNLDNTTQGKLAVGASIAESLSAAGVTTGNISKFLSADVSRSISAKKAIHQSPTATTFDAADPKVRYPSLSYQSPNEIIGQTRIDNLNNTTFPEDLTDKAAAYIALQFKSYKRMFSQEPGSTSDSFIVRLPLPENYNQTFAMNYSQKDRGFYGDVMEHEAGQRALNAVTRNNGLNLSSLGGIARTLTETNFEEVADLTSQLSLRAGYQTLDAFSDVAGSIAKQAGGMVPNPHTTIFFKGPDLRSFNWTWRLVPRNAKEAQAIRDIIKKIKKAILPKKEGNILGYPDFLQPVIEGSEVDMGKFKKCMVKSLAINYSAEGASAFFKDGHPVAIQLGMEFQEVEIMTREDV